MEATVDINKFVEIEFIDEGSYGKVYKIADIETRQIFAAKILKEPINSISDDDLIFLSREVNLNSGMDHPSVSKHIGFSPIGFNQSPNPVIIMKYYKNGPLKKFIKNKNQYKGLWNDTEKLILIFGIASGMMYLHAHNIIHRDLKLDNILLDDKLFAIICDFGHAKRIDSNGNFISIIESTKYAKGTPVYMAPEVFITNESSKESDVYAFGILLYEMLTETTPYEGFDLIHLLMAVQNGQRPLFTKPIDDSYKDLIERCWSQDPKDRPSFEEIVELLKNDKFITPNVNKKTFRSYVEYIESYNSSFTFNSIIKPENCIQFAQKQFQEYDLRSFNDRKTTFSTFLSKIGLFDENICPENVLEQLDTKCRELILDVKNDAEKQYLVGTYFIEQKCGFPLNIPLGEEYLERSISKGNTNSVVYLSKMLIDGVLINRDYQKASTYLSKHYGKDDRIFYLYGKVLKKKGNFKESFKKFKEGSEKNIIECYHEYGKHLFWGKGCTIDIKKAFHYFNLSRTEGLKKSDFYIKVFDKLKEYEYFNKLSTNNKYFFIKKVIEHNLKEHNKDDEIMLGNEIKIYSYEIYDCLINFAFQDIYFILMLKLFDSISIEIFYPMKLFELALSHLADIKKYLISDMNILVYLSKNQIPSDLAPFHVIDNIEIMPPVQKIQKFAFGKFSSLTQIKIPSSVKSIGEYAFCGCEKLTNIEILSSLTSIEKHTFDKCFSLIQIRIPSSVTLIDEYAFSECKSLEEIIIPSSVKSIGKKCFYNCSSLTNISFDSPCTLMSIQESTFELCSSLTKINIPPSITSFCF
ncbi:hypothetical protein M9Y10_014662 [Tritrichomonas musculus]|uniref:Protein kinase domain-containing protein n=1 Tax=Tritrichomonas musculus TaxID=1915356 RepID=A0ABR2L049_9EUKA